MTGRLLTRRTAPALVAALSLGIAGTADAATVSVSGSKLVVNGTANNDVVGLEFANPADLTKIIVTNSVPEAPSGFQIPILSNPATGCRQLNEYDVECTSQSGNFTAVDAKTTPLGGGNDYFTTTGTMPVVITVDGGAGDDYIRTGDKDDSVLGGAGDDQLFGRGGSDVFVPGAGDDDVWGNNAIDNNNQVPDDSASGAHDLVDLSANTAGVTISLDDRFNDVQDDEAGLDNIHSDVEDVVGTAFADTIVGSAKANIITGNAGVDSLTGNAGADTLTGNAGADTLTGNDGDDKLYGATAAATATTADDKTTASGGDGVDTILTGNGADVITAGDGNDTIAAGDGANDVNAGAGDDAITTGKDADKIDAGSGNDGTSAVPVAAGAGNNEVRLGDGTDYLTAGANDDTVFGGAGNDTISVSDGKNTVHGEDGDDVINTGTGIDNVTGDGGVDTIKTGDGDDTISGGLEADDMDAGAGTGDTISYEEKIQPVYAKVGGDLSGTFCGDKAQDGQACEGDKVLNAESLIGGAAGDHLIGNESKNTLSGRGGDDKLEGLAEADQLFGEAGDDNLEGGAAGDRVDGGDGTDFVSYRLTQANVNVTLDNTANDGANCPGSSCEADDIRDNVENIEGSQTGSDSLTGSDGPNTLLGLGGDDELNGKGGVDTLAGAEGDDQLDGGTGADAIDGGADSDTVHYDTRTAGVKVTLDDVADDGEAGEGDNVSSLVEDVLTGAGDDTLVGSDAGNLLSGGAGNDVIDGLLGADDIRGGTGVDGVVYSARPSTDTVSVTLEGLNNDGSGALAEHDNVRSDIENITTGDTRDFIEGSEQVNLISTGGGVDKIRAGANNDVVNSGAGDDYVDAGAGDDSIDGGTGADAIIGGAGTDTADYSTRTAAVTVTRDDVANDGEAGEGDNVDSSTENVNAPTLTQAQSEGDGSNDGSGSGDGGTTNTTGSTTTIASSNSTKQVNQTTTTKQSSATFAKATFVKGSLRRLVVRGKILVKARNGLAQSSAACKRGGKVRVTLSKGGKVVAKKLVKLGRTCSFKAPVTLPEGTTGKLKVEVKFLGNRALKASKRTTKLQVNG